MSFIIASPSKTESNAVRIGTDVYVYCVYTITLRRVRIMDLIRLNVRSRISHSASRCRQKTNT